MSHKSYLIVVATLMEIEPILSFSTIISETLFTSGVKIISAKLSSSVNIDFQIVITGVGVVNAAHGLTLSLEKIRCNQNREPYPKCDSRDLIIIHTGIAGSFEGSGLNIGDIAVATSDTYIHTGVSPNKSFSYPNQPLPFDVLPEKFLLKSNDYKTNREGRFIFDKAMVQNSCYAIKNRVTKNSNFRVITGDFITVSTITSSKEQADHIFKAFSRPCMESMEGAALAHIAALYNIPFIEVRAASNLVGIRDKEAWDMPLACERASFAVVSILNN
ncbi:MAG: futalosine hydrolase [Desulfamplus sp.]|nr:futalosine hydrolase [Desulfamplus sp.]